MVIYEDLSTTIIVCFYIHFYPEKCPSVNSGYLYPKGECLSTHRVGPLGLSGFLQLGLNGLSLGGMVRKHLPRGPLDTLSIYWCRKRFWRVSNLRWVRGFFENLENVLSP